MVCGTENLLATYYKGKQKSMLISNCIFRAGGVAYILSNVPSDVRRAKYRLDTTVRTHLGNRDEAYKYDLFLPPSAFSCNLNAQGTGRGSRSPDSGVPEKMFFRMYFK